LTTLVASIIIFGLLIFFHEFGHFIVAKKVGIGVLEFAIGFGPKIFSFEKDGTKYSLRALPLGGFCRLKGEDPEEVNEEDSFQGKSLRDRFAVIVAGPIMNFVLAILLFFLIYFFIFGVPIGESTRIGEVLPEGEASKVGMQTGDEITAINEKEVGKWDEVVGIINDNPEKEIAISFQRNDKNMEVTVVPQPDPQTDKGLIGIAPETRKYALFSSIGMGISNTWWFTQFIVVSIGEIITGQIEADVAGPIGIVQMVGEVAETGVSNLMTLAAILSIHLGLLNLLPIPALDGSRLMFFLLEGIRGKPVDPNKESFIHFIGFTLLILLMVFIAFSDLARLDIF